MSLAMLAEDGATQAAGFVLSLCSRTPSKQQARPRQEKPSTGELGQEAAEDSEEDTAEASPDVLSFEPSPGLPSPVGSYAEMPRQACQQQLRQQRDWRVIPGVDGRDRAGPRAAPRGEPPLHADWPPGQLCGPEAPGGNAPEADAPVLLGRTRLRPSHEK